MFLQLSFRRFALDCCAKTDPNTWWRRSKCDAVEIAIRKVLLGRVAVSWLCRRGATISPKARFRGGARLLRWGHPAMFDFMKFKMLFLVFISSSSHYWGTQFWPIPIWYLLIRLSGRISKLHWLHSWRRARWFGKFSATTPCYGLAIPPGFCGWGPQDPNIGCGMPWQWDAMGQNAILNLATDFAHP